jgi:hypothetical protein
VAVVGAAEIPKKGDALKYFNLSPGNPGGANSRGDSKVPDISELISR